MTIDLTHAAGLPVHLDEATGELRFGDGVTGDPHVQRHTSQLREVLRDPAATGPSPAYRLYRAVRRAGDEPLLASARLRYDLTVTLPGRIGAEYVKTAGHHHPPGPDGVSFPEVYEVVHGTAAFVLQRVEDVTAASGQVAEAWVQVCAAGDAILIPPACGHVTVNIADVPLVVADLVSVRCGNLYASYRALRGAAYHVLTDPAAEEGLRLVRNRAYSDPPRPVIAHGSRREPFLRRTSPLYAHVRERPGDFAFLDHPSSGAAELLALWRQPAP